MKPQATKTRFSLVWFGEAKALAGMVFSSSRWRFYYQRAFGAGIILSVLLHLVSILWVYVVSEKNTGNYKTVKIKTYYEKIPPPVKYEPTPPKLAKSFDLAKEQNQPTDVQPKDYTMEEPVSSEDLKADIRPTIVGSTSSVGGQGSVFHGALTSGETGGAEGWSIPAGTKSYGKSTGRGGSGGIYGGNDNSVSFGPDINVDVATTRTSGRGADQMTDQLIDYSNFSDRFEAYVEQNKNNKKDVRGYLNFYQLQYRGSMADENGEPSWNVVPRALPSLANYAEKFTKLKINLKGSIRLDDKLIMEIPLLFMMGSKGAPVYTQVEVKNLEKYLRNGGFLYIDDSYASMQGAFNRKVRSLIEAALGYDAEWEKIPSNHWLYRCFEEFSGPPPGEDDLRPNPEHAVKERYKNLEGIFLNGRLAVVLSSKAYTKAWGDWPLNPSSRGGPIDNVRQLQFGLNIIVFANTQKGGINERNKEKLANQK